MNKKPNKLRKGKISRWRHDAEFRLLNRKWLLYSSNIARRLLAAIEDTDNMNQAVLANKIGVSPQYVNKVLKGSENLTLETIGKLSDAVGHELISFPPYKYSIPANQMLDNQSNSIIEWGTKNMLGIFIAPILIVENKESVSTNIFFTVNENTLGYFQKMFNSQSPNVTSIPQPQLAMHGGEYISGS